MYGRFEIANLLQTPGALIDRIGEPHVMRPGKRREISHEWVVGPGREYPNDAHPGKEGRIILALETFHHASRKAFTSTLRVHLDGQGFRSTTIAFGARGEVVDVSIAPCPRFSAKAMREHHERARYLVQECSADHCGMTLAPGVGQYVAEVTT